MKIIFDLIHIQKSFNQIDSEKLIFTIEKVILHYQNHQISFLVSSYYNHSIEFLRDNLNPNTNIVCCFVPFIDNNPIKWQVEVNELIYNSIKTHLKGNIIWNDEITNFSLHYIEQHIKNISIIKTSISKEKIKNNLIKQISLIANKQSNLNLKKIACAVAQNFSNPNRKKQLLVDVSILHYHDANTGIQKVTKGYLNQMFLNPPKGFEVKPIYATLENDYRFSNKIYNQFNHSKIAIEKSLIEDDYISIYYGDILFVLDLNVNLNLYYKKLLKDIKLLGVKIYFIIHDLIPIYYSFWCTQSYINFFQWLKLVCNVGSNAICISNFTANQFKTWIIQQKIQTSQNFNISVNYNGVDTFSTNIHSDQFTYGLPIDYTNIIKKLKLNDISFIVVSTIEPRKGYEQILETFNLLWDKQYTVNLIIVGQQGWFVEKLIKKILKHPRLNTNLFWFKGISDEFLDLLYRSVNCLIVPSYVEGFGLPIIEAAQRNLPIIARDIEVFREIGKNNITYFKGQSIYEIVEVIENWMDCMELNKNDKLIQLSKIKYLSWQDSYKQLIASFIN